MSHSNKMKRRLRREIADADINRSHWEWHLRHGRQDAISQATYRRAISRSVDRISKAQEMLARHHRQPSNR